AIAPTIRFDPDVFHPDLPASIRLQSPIAIDGDLRIEGPMREGAPFVEVDGRYATRVLHVQSGRVRIANLVLTRGVAEDDGGCLRNEGTLVLEQVTISRCSALNGGGLASTGTVAATDVDFLQNEAAALGGGA